jgi:hypothetical protein
MSDAPTASAESLMAEVLGALLECVGAIRLAQDTRMLTCSRPAASILEWRMFLTANHFAGACASASRFTLRKSWVCS